MAHLYRTTVSTDAVLSDVKANGNLSGRLRESEVIVDPKGITHEIVIVRSVHTADHRMYQA